MAKPIVLTDKQFTMLRRVEAETARLTENPRLRADAGEMKAASDLLEEAEDLQLPDVALVGLRNWVNRYGHNDNRTNQS